jgi:hypothetical protein
MSWAAGDSAKSRLYLAARSRCWRAPLAIASFLICCSSALAQRSQPWMDAQRLLSECTAAAGSFEETDCSSYAEGVKDMLAYLREHRVGGIPLPCLPPTMSVGQLEAVVTTFIRRNPQLYNAPAAPAIYASLIEAFPCR